MKHIIEKKNYKRSNWKNGLGFTEEIAIHPAGSSLSRGDFLWRLSSASIEKSSPFSVFPAHDRVLIVLKGAGIRMIHTFEEGEPEEVAEVLPGEPYEFPGDIPSRCELLDGPITDFSVFARTGEVAPIVTLQTLLPGESFAWNAEGKWNFVHALEQGVTLDLGALKEGDTFSTDAGEVALCAGADGARVLFISLQA